MADPPASDLVTSEEIAQRLGMKRRTSVNTLLERRTDGFPLPIINRGKIRLWSWTEVREWAIRTGRLAEPNSRQRPEP